MKYFHAAEEKLQEQADGFAPSAVLQSARIPAKPKTRQGVPGEAAVMEGTWRALFGALP